MEILRFIAIKYFNLLTALKVIHYNKYRQTINHLKSQWLQEQNTFGLLVLHAGRLNLWLDPSSLNLANKAWL